MNIKKYCMFTRPLHDNNRTWRSKRRGLHRSARWHAQSPSTLIAICWDDWRNQDLAPFIKACPHTDLYCFFDIHSLTHRETIIICIGTASFKCQVSHLDYAGDGTREQGPAAAHVDRRSGLKQSLVDIDRPITLVERTKKNFKRGLVITRNEFDNHWLWHLILFFSWFFQFLNFLFCFHSFIIFFLSFTAKAFFLCKKNTWALKTSNLQDSLR